MSFLYFLIRLITFGAFSIKRELIYLNILGPFARENFTDIFFSSGA